MFRGKKYKKIAESFDRTKAYDLKEAIEILKKSELKFDQTVEVHFNLGVDPKHSDQVVGSWHCRASAWYRSSGPRLGVLQGQQP